MHITQQFFRILCGALARVTTITLVVGMLVTSALAQNPVHPRPNQSFQHPARRAPERPRPQRH